MTMSLAFLIRCARQCAAALLLIALAGCAASIHHRVGMSAMGKGEYGEAIRELQQAAELAPQDVYFRKDWLQSREAATQRLLAKAALSLSEGKTAAAEAASGSSNTTAPHLKLSELLSLNRDSLSITAPSATINVQKIDGDANLLANPRLRVRDREKAKILIGDKVPVVTTTTTPNGFLSENIQYLDVGLKLEVEPEIRLRDEIGLKMSLEVSSVVATIKTTSGSQAYQIGTRNFNSVLRLKDGETFRLRE